MNAMADPSEFWRSRLHVPNYRVVQAARYADLSAQTVTRWHSKPGSNARATLSSKEDRAALSYLQLIEVAVVASFRKSGIPLRKIRAARDYLQRTLEAKYPFAEYRFKTEGRELWLDYAQIEAKQGDKRLLSASQGGQLAWSSIIGRLKEFDYETDGLAVRWHVAGPRKKVVIDPRVQFGAPSINGVATSVIKGRWNAGEELSEIADDYEINSSDIRDALLFEGVELDSGRETRH